MLSFRVGQEKSHCARVRERHLGSLGLLMLVAGRPLVVANWKLHGDTDFTARLLGQLKSRLTSVEGIDLVVCLPFVFLELARKLLADSNIALGAQHVSDQNEGAYTGEVSARMLKDVGCDYVIVGHSERRRLYHEDDQSTACRLVAAYAAGLMPVLCVGETLAQRQAGATDQVISEQLKAIGLVEPGFIDSWVVAYEPVWAIGTGDTPSPEQLGEVRAIIQKQLGASGVHRDGRVIYGGSIVSGNAAALLGVDGIDGGLVGGASLDSDSFSRIVRSMACVSVAGG